MYNGSGPWGEMTKMDEVGQLRKSREGGDSGRFIISNSIVSVTRNG